MKKDKEPYEKDYRAEYYKAVCLLRMCHPLIEAILAIAALNSSNTQENIQKLKSEIEDII